MDIAYHLTWYEPSQVQEDGKYILKAIYTILGLGFNGKKEVVKLYLCENKGAYFRLQALTYLNIH